MAKHTATKKPTPASGARSPSGAPPSGPRTSRDPKRQALVEIDRVAGTTAPPVSVKSRTLKQIFKDAGIELEVEHDASKLEAPLDDRFDLPLLHQYMTANRRANRPDWYAHVLVVPTIRWQEGFQIHEPLGVMYDDPRADLNGIPREGCALSMSEIGGNKAEYLRTLAHELGHVFNLQHPKVAQDHSIMATTEDLIGDGGYPGNIEFDFNQDDKDWLREGPEDQVRPGGSPSRSGDTSNVRPKAGAPPPLSLSIDAPNGPFELDEPVHLRVTLRNGTEAPIETSSHLSASSGNLEIRITRPNEKTFRFRPLVAACFKSAPTTLAPNEEFLSTEPIFFGALGHSFKTVGTYRIRAQYRTTLNGKPYVAVAAPREIKLKASRGESPMSDPGVARFLILRGGRHFQGARQALEAVVEQGKSSRAALHARLALAADALRTEAPDTERAKRLLAPLDLPVLDRAQRAECLRLRAAASKEDQEACLVAFADLLKKSRAGIADRAVERTRAWVNWYAAKR